MQVKVLIVDDHPVFLAGLRALLEMNDNIEVVGEATDGQEAVNLQNQLKPDIVLMDINMPSMNGIVATKEILSINPKAKVLALSIHSSKQFVRGMLDAGASGYLLKVAVPEELIMAIEKLMQGDMYLSSTITKKALEKEKPVIKEAEKNILSTKLHRPPVTKEHVYRDHLIDLLNKNKDKPVTLVSAGAGYGKSMLISSWLETSEIPYAWFSLGKDDNDFRNFILGIAASLKKRFPKALKKCSEMMSVAEIPSPHVLTECFINGLDEIPNEFVLVLDDYHLIKNNDINDFINMLLQYPPQLMHLVIITRRDPLLNINKLRAGSRMNEIRMSDLSLGIEEIGQLFKNLLNLDLKINIIESLHSRTEGWVAGLRLYSLIMKGAPNVESTLNNVPESLPLITNYLIQEVFSNISIDVQAHLMRTSIMNRFCSSLPDFVNDTVKKDSDLVNSGQEFIDWLLKSGLFIIPLDDSNEWFRYHHLCQDLLLKQLNQQKSKEEIKGYHLKASEWFDQNGYKEEAIKHAISGEDLNTAVDLVLKYQNELMETGEVSRFNSLIDLLPISLFEKTPALLTAKAFVMEYRAQLDELIKFKEKAKTLLSKISDKSQEVNAIRGEVETLEGELFLLSGDGKNTFNSSKRALSLLPLTASYVQSFAWGMHIVSFQLLNKIEELDKISIENQTNSNFFKSRIHGWHAIAYAMQGDTRRLKIHSQKIIDLSEKFQFSESVVYGKYFLSVALYLSMESDKAEPYLKSVVDNPFLARPHYLANCAFILASIYIQKREIEKANELMANIVQHIEDSKNTMVASVVEAMLVELALKEGNIDKAILLDSQLETYVFYPPIWFNYVSQLTPIKLKLAINTKESVLEAIQLLAEIEEHLRQTNKITILIDFLILQAVALNCQGNKKEALLKITEALSLSKVGNCIRTFVDYSSSLGELMMEHLNDIEFGSHVRKIVYAIDQNSSTNNQSNNKQDNTSEALITESTIGTLTFREMEILKLVAKGLRNKEIAEKLFVSDGTIKKHIFNISKKLGTTNRVGSVRKAESLGII